MAAFDWSGFVQFLPSPSSTEKGKDIKVALLDSGVDFNHPALSHLERDGRHFDATKITLQVDNNSLTGKDNVFDPGHFQSYHGSNLAGIMAGDSQQAGEEYTGIAPAMDLYIFKVSEPDGDIWLDDYIRALDYAVNKLDVDIICSAVYPERNLTSGILKFTSPEITTILDEITNKNILFFQALPNVNRPQHLTSLSFPASRAAALKIGAMTNRFHQEVLAGQGDDLDSNIDYIVPQFSASVCDEGPNGEAYTTNLLTASQSTAVLCGIASLVLQQQREQSGDATMRFDHDGFKALLANNATPMNGADVFTNPVQLCTPI
ncbi:MAG: S8/S53 family peptidase [Bacteroidota bacterium]